MGILKKTNIQIKGKGKDLNIFNAKDNISEIIQLHENIKEQFINLGNTILELSIRIGELLSEEKAKVSHGQWESWINNNLPFGERQCQKYIRIWERRLELKANSEFAFKSVNEITKFISESKKNLKNKNILLIEKNIDDIDQIEQYPYDKKIEQLLIGIQNQLKPNQSIRQLFEYLVQTDEEAFIKYGIMFLKEMKYRKNSIQE